MKTNKLWMTLRFPGNQKCSVEYWTKRYVGKPLHQAY